jgi:ligand-binding sensor domain-containing protein
MNRLSGKIHLILVLLILAMGSVIVGFRVKEVAKTSFTSSKTIENNEEYNKKKGEKSADGLQSLEIYDIWTHYTIEDGLPSNKVNCVKVDGDRILVGTDKGLAIMEDGEVTSVFKEEDGLAHHNVVSIDISSMTGDIWIGTMSGLNRFSAGEFETFNQFNSGMPNDVVYQVYCVDKYVWVATGGGAGCLDMYTKQWKIFTEHNAPMHEPWTYGISGGDGKVFIAAWGGGIIEYELETGQMRDYVDPDHEMEIDLFPDDGVVHDITTGSDYSEGLLWVGTYFGLSRYDGARWKGYFDHDSGLASNFINFTKADGRAVWLCTDNGVSNFNGHTWVTYRPHSNGPKGDVIITEGDEKQVIVTNTSMSNNFVWGMDIDDKILWLATAKGLSRAEASGKQTARANQ